MSFAPKFNITSEIASALMRIEAAKQAVEDLPITPSVQATLRATARLFSTHYSTAIEGNRLTQEQVVQVIEHQGHFAGRERDEKEVLGYYAALEKVEQLAATRRVVTEKDIQTLHALVMGGGSTKVKPTPYRDGQNVIRDARSKRIVYLPPESQDVPPLMMDLVSWLQAAEEQELPCPLRAGIAHYQFATIHPYYDGNGRTARLLTTLILHLGGYDLKGLYALEEYYARKLNAYYEALTLGPSHNYYLGRAEADITRWVAYFCDGTAASFESVRKRAQEAAAELAPDSSPWLRKLDPRQRRALELFLQSDTLTSRDLESLFGVSRRTARHILSRWVQDEFVVVLDPAKKSRKYGLAEAFQQLLHQRVPKTQGT